MEVSADIVLAWSAILERLSRVRTAEEHAALLADVDRFSEMLSKSTTVSEQMREFHLRQVGFVRERLAVINPGAIDVLMCAACCYEVPLANFSIFLQARDRLFPFGDRYAPRPHPDGFGTNRRAWSRKLTFWWKNRPPLTQRCDFCLGEHVCERCGKPFEHRELRRDEDYIKGLKLGAGRYPVPPRCRDCEKDCHVLTPEEQAVLAALIDPASTTSHDATKPDPSGLVFGGDAIGQPLTISESQRQRHVYIIGGTGSGKSVLLANLATQDIRAGRGVAVIDPHGDLAEKLIRSTPPERLSDVVYFDPTDEHAPAFNLLAMPFEPSKLAQDIVAAFKLFFGDTWGHQMDALLRSTLLTLLLDREHEPHSLADLRSMLVDERYRDHVVNRLADPIMRSFWVDEFPRMTKDAARPILNRLSALLVPGSPLRRVIESRTNALDLTTIMNTRRVLLVNLSKGALGEEPSRLLGGLIVTAITQAALARQSIPEAQRVPFNLYCDEFQNFADLPSTESILSEARKYQLRLVLAHQTMSQINSRLMANILGNVRTLVTFRVSYDDASKLAHQMGRQRFVYPDTGDFYDLTLQRQRLARTLIENSRKNIDGTTTVPEHHDGYGRKGFSRYENAATVLAWLTETASVDPSSFDPGRPTEFTWKTVTWPVPQMFQNLSVGRAFIMRDVATSTTELVVPPPQPIPYPTHLAVILDRQRAARPAELPATATAAPKPPTEKNRPPQMPQEPRSPAGTTHPTDENSTVSPSTSPPDDTDDFLT